MWLKLRYDMHKINPGYEYSFHTCKEISGLLFG